jgi:hypothetical protein
MTLDQRLAPTGTSRRREALCVAGVVSAGLAAGATLLIVDPNQPGHYPTCPFLATTGWYCPGCGSLRAVHDLLHGDLAGALARNPMMVLALPYLLLAAVTWLLRATGRPAPRSTSLPAWVIWLILGGVIAFGVLRNLAGWTWLSPA